MTNVLGSLRSEDGDIILKEQVETAKCGNMAQSCTAEAVLRCVDAAHTVDTSNISDQGTSDQEALNKEETLGRNSMGNMLSQNSNDCSKAETSKGGADMALTKESGPAPDINSSNGLLLNCCFGCQKMEQTPMTFEKCEQCVREKWTIVRVYCSTDCRTADWNRRHGFEHSIGERDSDYAGNELDID